MSNSLLSAIMRQLLPVNNGNWYFSGPCILLGTVFSGPPRKMQKLHTSFLFVTQGDKLRAKLLSCFYGRVRSEKTTGNQRPAAPAPGSSIVVLNRANMTLVDVQCQLDKEGGSDLVIDLVMKNTGHRVFQESVELGIALLEGGNTRIQVRLGV